MLATEPFNFPSIVEPSEAIASNVPLNYARDAYITEFGKATLADRYLLPNEDFQQLFARVAAAYADNQAHANRLYDYMSKLWFMPSTPILSNAGTTRGLPISCFLNEVADNLESIAETWNENIWLAAKGGGIGTYWGNVRAIGEEIGLSGKSSGIIPFIHVMDSLTLAISQGSLRRGSSAVYLDIHHPEIEEFLEIRKPSGDFNRKSLNIHHAVNITDEFMLAVKEDKLFTLKSPKTHKVIKKISARMLWQKILENRLQTGEPYLIFIDTVNKQLCQHHQLRNLKVKMSNLCSEILLPTGYDYQGRNRTAICCLSSVNALKWDEWYSDTNFIEDIMRFLDNVLSYFISNAPKQMENAIYAAQQERSVGLGLMGFHSLLQSKRIPFESAIAKSLNKQIFKHIRQKADAASYALAEERGACPDAAALNLKERFSYKLAIAPTASISIICGGISAGIEPIPANIYTHKTLCGSFTVKNTYLEDLLNDKGLDTREVWESILEHEGSVQHLPELTQYEKDVFKTSFEIDQRWIIDFAADRTPYVCQGQSLNLFLAADIDKWDLLMLHWLAWEKGVKSLYYCRSKSIQRASYINHNQTKAIVNRYDECLACQ